MQLESITRPELQQFVSVIQNGQPDIIGVVLVNGVTIYGEQPHDNMVQENLRLEFGGRHDKKTVEIPIEHISGLFEIDFHQDGPSVSLLGDGRLESAEAWMYEMTEKAAEQYDYSVEDVGRMYNVSVTSGFNRGDIEFDSRTPLYCDWNFYSSRAGGVDSVGFTVMGIGGSAGWDSSLWKEFENTVERHETDLNRIHGQGEVVVRGYIDFIQKDESYLTEEMEGGKWFTALISSTRPTNEEDLADKWAVGYFREDAFMFPREHWDKISTPVHTFGEVVDAPMETPFGDVDSYIKVRGSAYLDE